MMLRFAFLTVAFSVTAAASLSINDDGAKVTILDGKKPVLVYNYQFVNPPEGVPAKYRRSSYIHPLYGPYGDVISQDFPKDHYHHRGVFWAWPDCTVGDRKMDVWIGEGVHQVYESCFESMVYKDHVTLGFQNVWEFDGESQPQVRERIEFSVYKRKGAGRAIDFDLNFENVSDKDVTFKGSPVEQKGYGGLCFRPIAENKPFTFTTASGVVPEDALSSQTPWADCTWKLGWHTQGLAIFQNPADPGYPHPGWIFRHYGFLGASWPHNDAKVLKPGESFRLQYRMYIHKGTAGEAGVAKAFAKYVAATKKD